MRHQFPLSIILMALFASVSTAAHADVTITSGEKNKRGTTAIMTVAVSGHKLRASCSVFDFIEDFDAGTSIMIINEMKAYSVSHDPDIFKPVPAHQKPDYDSFVNTGRKTIVSGYTYTHYIVTKHVRDLAIRTDILATKDISGIDPEMLVHVRRVLGDYLPFEGIAVEETTTTTVRGHAPVTHPTECILSVSRQPIPTSTFQVPAGYRKIDQRGGFFGAP